VASEVGPEVEVEDVEGNVLVRYTSAFASRPDSFRTPDASIPQEIKRSFTLLARYYASPSTHVSPTPITASLLAFLDNFIANRITPTSFHTVTVQNLSAIEDRLLVDTIRWARSEGITFPSPRLSIQPVHQAQGLSIQPVHQAQRLSIQGPSVHPVQQAQGLSIQSVHQAQGLSIQPVHQAQRLLIQGPSVQPVHQDQELSIQPRQHRLQIEYELPAGVSAVPGSPGTVLIPIQVENSSKKRKVRLQLVQPSLNQLPVVPLVEHSTHSRPEVTSMEISLDLPDASDAMSSSSRMLKRREYSPTGSLSEYEDEVLADPPSRRLAIEESQSKKFRGKQRERSPQTHLARHGDRQPSVIPESEDDDAMEGICHSIEEPPSSPIARPEGRRQSPKVPPATSVTVPEVTQPGLSPQYPPIEQYMPTQPAFQQQPVVLQQEPVSQQQPVQQQQPVLQQQPMVQQQPVQQYSPLQQLPSPLQALHQYSPQQYLPQQYVMPQYPLQQPQQYTLPQQYMPIPQQPQSTAALENIAAQMANLAMALSRNQGTMQAEVADLPNAPARAQVPMEPVAPALKPSDIATFEPRNQSDADAASKFIDSIRDTISHYGEARTRVVLRRCCKGPAAEDWVAGMSDDDPLLLRTNCRHWIDLLERDFMPYLAFRLSVARAETFRWNQGRTPAEYVAKKLRLLRMANITNEDDIVEELHRGLVDPPNLHLHLDKYVTEDGNSISEYRRAVARLQDSAKCEGTIQSPQPRSSTRHPFFRETNRPRTQFSDMRQETPAPASTTAGVVSARNPIGSTSSLSSPSTRTGKQVRQRLRKCKNYPGCGDGEHWDWQCIHRGNMSNQVKRAYYAEPRECESENDDGYDMADTLIDELEPQASLEQEYEHTQNAYLATRYLEEKGLGFMGTHKSIRAKTHRPSMTCRNCAAVFTSNNKLHKHLRDPCKGSANFMDGGSQLDKNALPIVVESRAVIAVTAAVLQGTRVSWG